MHNAAFRFTVHTSSGLPIYRQIMDQVRALIAGGRLVPVIGAVSMDLTTIDITDAPGLAPGDAVTLLGQEGSVALNAQQIARWAGTISYMVLCGISPRVPRVYV